MPLVASGVSFTKTTTYTHVADAAAFVKDGRQLVDESVTNPREQSTILKDRAAVRKVGAVCACG